MFWTVVAIRERFCEVDMMRAELALDVNDTDVDVDGGIREYILDVKALLVGLMMVVGVGLGAGAGVGVTVAGCGCG